MTEFECVSLERPWAVIVRGWEASLKFPRKASPERGSTQSKPAHCRKLVRFKGMTTHQPELPLGVRPRRRRKHSIAARRFFALGDQLRREVQRERMEKIHSYTGY